MSNSFFQFKKFTIHQDKSAMKVCTDACLFGAWTGRHSGLALRALDIGTGTGLLSLMYCQVHPEVEIDAVEIDPDAAAQAADNFSASLWPQKFLLHDVSAQEFFSFMGYDVIICNPPFYENDLPSPSSAKNKAKHSTELNFKELIKLCNTWLLKFGKAFILLPYHRTDEFVQAATKAGFFLRRLAYVKQSPTHDYFRSMVYIQRKPVIEPKTEELIIKDADGQYHPDFVNLLKDFYLEF